MTRVFENCTGAAIALIVSAAVFTSTVSAFEFNDSHFCGDYSYSANGVAEGSGFPIFFVETGIFSADCDGGITAEGIAVFNGTETIAVAYDCDYDIDMNGTTPVDCTRTADGDDIPASFFLVLEDQGRAFRFIGIPTDFAIQVSGSGRKQSDSDGILRTAQVSSSSGQREVICEATNVSGSGDPLLVDLTIFDSGGSVVQSATSLAIPDGTTIGISTVSNAAAAFRCEVDTRGAVDNSARARIRVNGNGGGSVDGSAGR